METGVELISKERQEQIVKHGFVAAHDDAHSRGEILIAAKCIIDGDYGFWPWEAHSAQNIMIKPRAEQLTIAGALIAAEIDRLQRIKTD